MHTTLFTEKDQSVKCSQYMRQVPETLATHLNFFNGLLYEVPAACAMLAVFRSCEFALRMRQVLDLLFERYAQRGVNSGIRYL
jgi:hypothetical protein